MSASLISRPFHITFPSTTPGFKYAGPDIEAAIVSPSPTARPHAATSSYAV